MKITSLAYSRPEDDPKHRKNPDAVRPAPSPLGLAALGVGGGGSSSSSSGLTIGTTTITSGTDTKVLYNNAGVVGEYSITGTGNVVMSASPTLTGTAAMASASLSGSLTFTELALVRVAASPVIGKKSVTLRLDEDLLAFFRQGGPGYQTRINAVLRAYMSLGSARS